jgi:hypothetical protein
LGAAGGFVQRVGWIRMGALGDLLVGLASLREVIDQWPDAKVSVIGPKLWLEILEPGFWPQIDRVVVIERKKSAAIVYKRTDMFETRVSGQPVQQCRGHLRVAKHAGPFREAQVGGDDHAGPLVQLGQ